MFGKGSEIPNFSTLWFGKYSDVPNIAISFSVPSPDAAAGRAHDNDSLCSESTAVHQTRSIRINKRQQGKPY